MKINDIMTSTLIFLISGTLFMGCSTGQRVKKYRIINSKKIKLEELNISPDMMDNYRAFQVFFRLEKVVDSIRVEVSPSHINNKEVMGQIRKAFISVEKVIDLRNFKENRKFIFPYIGKNFDRSWKRRADFIIFTSKTNPIRRLDKKSTYRIRFSTFSLEKYNFTIKIHADCKVNFLDKIQP